MIFPRRTVAESREQWHHQTFLSKHGIVHSRRVVYCKDMLCRAVRSMSERCMHELCMHLPTKAARSPKSCASASSARNCSYLYLTRGLRFDVLPQQVVALAATSPCWGLPSLAPVTYRVIQRTAVLRLVQWLSLLQVVPIGSIGWFLQHQCQ